MADYEDDLETDADLARREALSRSLIGYQSGSKISPFHPASPVNDLDLVAERDINSGDIQRKAEHDKGNWIKRGTQWLRSLVQGGMSDTGPAYGVAAAWDPGAFDPKQPAPPNTAAGWAASGARHLKDTGLGMVDAALASVEDTAGWREKGDIGQYSPNTVLLPAHTMPLMALQRAIMRGEAQSAHPLTQYAADSKGSVADRLRAYADDVSNGPAWKQAEDGRQRHGLGVEDQGIVGEGAPGIPGKVPELANPVGTLSRFARDRSNITGHLPGEKIVHPPNFEDIQIANQIGQPGDRFHTIKADAGDAVNAAIVGAGSRLREEGATVAPQRRTEPLRTTSAIKTWLERAGVPQGSYADPWAGQMSYHERIARGPKETDYVTLRTGPDPIAHSVEFRVPSDGHPAPLPDQARTGRADTRGRTLNMIDTAPATVRGGPADLYRRNVRGDPYNPSTSVRGLEEALKRYTSRTPNPRASWMTEPGTEPRWSQRAEDPVASKMPEGADFHPDQLKLLAKGDWKPGFITAYHGTNSDVVGGGGFGKRIEGGNGRGPATYWNTDPRSASAYALGDTNRITPKGDAGPNVMRARIEGDKLFNENELVDRKTLRRFADAHNSMIRERAAKSGREVHADELYDPKEFSTTYFDRAYKPHGYNVLQTLSYDAAMQNELLGRLGYKGRFGDPQGTGGARFGQDIAVFPGHESLIELYAKAGDKKAAALAGNKQLAKPAVVTDPKMFDLNPKKLAKVPNVPQVDFPEPTWAKGTPLRVLMQKLTGKRNMDRMRTDIDRGDKMGGRGWYNNDQLLERFKAEFGPEKGHQRFKQYMDMVSATSPINKVHLNIRDASYRYGRWLQGEPAPEKGFKPAPGYGSKAQQLHNQNVRNFMEEGGLDPLQNPKPFRFAENLAGNQRPVTVDSHAARNVRMKDSLGRLVEGDPGSAYGYMADIYRQLARERDMTPAQAQASGWLGAGKETGLKSNPNPFLAEFQERIRHTAARRGLKPEEVLRRMMKGSEPLLAKAGDSKTAALTSALDRVQGRAPDDAAYDRQRGTDMSYRDHALGQGKRDLYGEGPLSSHGNAMETDARLSENPANYDKRWMDAQTEYKFGERPEGPLWKLNAKAGDNLSAILAGLDKSKVKRAVDATRDVSYGNRQTLMEKQFGVGREHGEWWKDYLSQQGIKPDAGPRAMIEKAIEKNRQDWKRGRGFTQSTSQPDFPERLKAAIEKHGGNQRLIADELGISQATTSRWMRKPEGGKVSAANPRPSDLPAAKHGGWATGGVRADSFRRSLERNGGSVAKTAESLGISQSTAYSYMKTKAKKSNGSGEGGESTLMSRLDDKNFVRSFLASMEKHHGKPRAIVNVADELDLNTGAVSKYRDQMKWKPGMTEDQASELRSQSKAVKRETEWRPQDQVHKPMWDEEGRRAARNADYEAARRAADEHGKRAEAKAYRESQGQPYKSPVKVDPDKNLRGTSGEDDLSAVQRLIKEKKLRAEGGDEKTAAITGSSQLDKIRQEARKQKLAERYQETDASREEQSQANRISNAERNLGRTEQDTARPDKNVSDADWDAARKAAAEHRSKDKEVKASGGSRYFSLLAGGKRDGMRGLISRAIGNKQDKLEALHQRRIELEDKVDPHIKAAKGDQVSDMSPEGQAIWKQLKQVGIDIKAAEKGKNRGGWTKNSLASATPADEFDKAPRTTGYSMGGMTHTIDKMQAAHKRGATDAELWDIAHDTGGKNPFGYWSDPEVKVDFTGKRMTPIKPHGWVNLLNIIKGIDAKTVMEGEVGTEVYPKGRYSKDIKFEARSDRTIPPFDADRIRRALDLVEGGMSYTNAARETGGLSESSLRRWHGITKAGGAIERGKAGVPAQPKLDQAEIDRLNNQRARSPHTRSPHTKRDYAIDPEFDEEK